METGQLELTLDAVNIQTLCDRAYTQAQQLQPSKDTSPEEATSQTPFTLEIEPSLEMLVADDLRLRQMLVHLLSNALKFTEAGGAIGLKVTRWEGWIAFTVWDTGIGIPPQKQHLIFQKFQQLENPLTRRFEGTGLGLVLTQRLARLHGGDISFISKVGEGSQFTLLLPPCPPLEARGNEQFISSSPNSLVLIVEATPHYIEALTDQLTSLGYRVVIARSGTEAIEKARRLQPCAVLLNPLLPLLSGWDVLTLLKSDHQTRHIPVLVMATWAEKEQAYQNQADGFLSLPIEGTALQESLNQLTPPKSSASSSLMILRLTPFSSSHPEKMAAPCLKLEDTSNQEEISFLSPNYELNYRVLEADDLEQAELLARVWHPHVVLLESCDLEDPLTYLRQLTQHTHLASLPLVTLDHQTTAAANQITELSVFPCLETTQSHKTAALLQAIQVAAGLCWKPNILVVDITQLSDLSVPVYARSTSLEGRNLASSEPYPTFTYGQGNMTIEEENSDEVQASRSAKFYTTHSQIEWLQALIQYLQAAGFTSLLSSSWTEVYRHLQHQNVDLLVIYIGEIYAEQQLVQGLTFLAQQSEKPPILVLDHRLEPSLNDEAVDDGERILKTIASQIVRGSSQSMAELLNVINQMLVPKDY
jgi:CheY-like chemotaxis protein